MPQFSEKIKLFLKASLHRLSLPKTLLLVSLAVYFAFGFYHLSDFITADEHFWLPNSGFERIDNYWTAIKKGKWDNTRINDKPGITLAWTAGIAKLFDNGKGQIIKENSTFKQFNPERTRQINFLYRLPILVLSGLFSFFFFWILRKITGDEWIALWSAICILLSPILLGISQIVNPDSLFWIFASASFLCFFSYLQTPEKKTAALSGIFLGLGLASKYVSVILFPFFFFMMLIFYLFEFEKWKEKRGAWRQLVVKNSFVYLAVLAGGMLLFAILMPASFVDPKVFYESTIGFPGMRPIFLVIMGLNALIILDSWLVGGKVLFFLLTRLSWLKKFITPLISFILASTAVFLIVNYFSHNSLMNLKGIPFDMKQKDAFSQISILKRFVVEFRALVFALTPLVLFALVFTWVKSIFLKSRHELLVLILSSFFLIFYAAVIFQGLLVTTRYSILLFPFSIILAAIAIREFFTLEENSAGRKVIWVFAAVLSGILLLHCFSLFEQAYPETGTAKTLVRLAKVYALSVPFVLAATGLISRLIILHFPWKKLLSVNKAIITLGIIIISVVNLWLVKPFYFSYTNDLLPKDYIISGAWGYGGYEAAQYLNNLPDSQNLIVWADVYGVCEFFKGKCIHRPKVDTVKYKINYYFRSLQSSTPLNFPHSMESKAVWRLTIDQRQKSFLKILKAKPLNQADITNNTNSDEDGLNNEAD